MHRDHKIRDKNEADGSIPCPGEIGVYLFDKIQPCESSKLFLIFKGIFFPKMIPAEVIFVFGEAEELKFSSFIML